MQRMTYTPLESLCARYEHLQGALLLHTDLTMQLYLEQVPYGYVDDFVLRKSILSERSHRHRSMLILIV